MDTNAVVLLTKDEIGREINKAIDNMKLDNKIKKEMDIVYDIENEANINFVKFNDSKTLPVNRYVKSKEKTGLILMAHMENKLIAFSKYYLEHCRNELVDIDDELWIHIRKMLECARKLSEIDRRINITNKDMKIAQDSLIKYLNRKSRASTTNKSYDFTKETKESTDGHITEAALTTCYVVSYLIDDCVPLLNKMGVYNIVGEMYNEMEYLSDFCKDVLLLDIRDI